MTTRIYPCQLIRVIDADTVVLRIDVGFRLYTDAAIRIHGVNAPEMSTVEGKDARLWAINWFTEHTPKEVKDLWPFTLICHGSDPRDKYGRWLGNVLDAFDASYAQAILAAHKAVPYNP